MQAISAQLSRGAPAAPAAGAPQGLRALKLRPAPPAWRLNAASLFAPEPSGPFSFWPRPATEAARKPQAAASKRKPQGEEPLSVSSLDLEPEHPSLGKQKFRSALEQVSYYTSEINFHRE